ncbi:MAG: SDR family oxidoreductase [Chloroflexi bacterium]|nr:SDR family oxidoreductase [Chloroflexota bacterium]OJV93275.1 MAG: 3-beta hydroxysteroid dehydrogenase [Chloroflexi bacterium 54-19]
MKVFVTGATGWVGSATVKELLAAGHQVLGLARSEVGAEALARAGAEVQRGSLDDLDSLRSGAAWAEGVIHTAFIHDFSNFARSVEVDQLAIRTLGEVLAGSNRPLIVTAGTGGLVSGRAVTEEDAKDPSARVPRFSEEAGLAQVGSGIRASVMRLPPSVHGEGDHGFVPGLIEIARAKGVSGYPGDGSNRWAAVHRLDAARLYRLALENAPAGTILHAIGDEGVAIRDMAAIIGRHLNVPVVSVPLEQAADHFGWLGHFITMDSPASSALTEQRFGWKPVEIGLLEDLDHDYYYKIGSGFH